MLYLYQYRIIVNNSYRQKNTTRIDVNVWIPVVYKNTQKLCKLDALSRKCVIGYFSFSGLRRIHSSQSIDYESMNSNNKSILSRPFAQIIRLLLSLVFPHLPTCKLKMNSLDWFKSRFSCINQFQMTLSIDLHSPVFLHWISSYYLPVILLLKSFVTFERRNRETEILARQENHTGSTSINAYIEEHWKNWLFCLAQQIQFWVIPNDEYIY